MARNPSLVATGTIARTAVLLGSFDEQHPRLTLTELANRSGLATTTTHRMLQELVRTGLLSKGSDNRYSIGLGLWEVGELSPLSLVLRETALPELLTIYEAISENVHFAVLDGFDALYVARLVGPHSVPTMSRMGGRLPLHTTGVGKVLLAHQDESYLRSYFSRPLERPTRFSVTDESRLRQQIVEIKRSGYSETRQEQTLGTISLAVGVFGRDAQPLAAVGLVTHSNRADTTRMIPLLRKAAAGISENLLSVMDRNDSTSFH